MKSPAKAPTRRSLKPSGGSRWIAFLAAHPAPYTAVFAVRKGTTHPTTLVRRGIGALATGNWETLTVDEAGSKGILVAFADKADFDRVKAHFKGRPWNSNVIGSVDGFSVTVP